MELLISSDPSSLEMPEFLEAYPPTDSDYNRYEVRVSPADYNIFSEEVCDNAVSERQGAPPLEAVSSFLSEQPSLIVHQAESSVPQRLDSDNRGILTGNGVGNTLKEENSYDITDWTELIDHLYFPVMEDEDPDNAGGASASPNNIFAMLDRVVLDNENHDILPIQPLASETPCAPPSTESELEVNGSQMFERNFMHYTPPPLITAPAIGSNLEIDVKQKYCVQSNFMQRTLPPLISAPSINSNPEVDNGNQICERKCTPYTAPPHLLPHGEVEKNTVDPSLNGDQHQPLMRQVMPRRRLVIEKELTGSDIAINVTGIKLPKESVESHFGIIPEGSQGLAVTIHDAMTQDATAWGMRFTVVLKTTGSLGRTTVYILKDTWKYLQHHALNEGDWLQIFLQEPGDRYIVKYEKGSAEHHPPLHHMQILGKTWRMIIRKMLRQKDCMSGKARRGAIGLEKRKIEDFFPYVPTKEGRKMELYDWEKVHQPWEMTLKFTEHVGGRIYRLENTAQFCKFHGLQKGDYLEIFKSDGPDARYALRGRRADDRT
ncbi:unnamed protein product [Calypogeia fissa]